MTERSDQIRSKAVREMRDLILQAIGNLSPGGPICIEHAKDLLKAALKLEGQAAGWSEPMASSACPHCGRDTPHQHVIDRKGKVHS